MSEAIIRSSKVLRNKRRNCSPTLIDVHIGKRLKIRRNMLGLTQEKLADLIGVTFQQIQKYEQGKNRISAARLYDLSIILQTPIQFFFDEMDEKTIQNSPRSLRSSPFLPKEELL